MKDFIIKILKVIIVFGIVALGMFFVPELVTCWSAIIQWIIDLGTWGIVIIASAIFYLLISIILD